MSKNELISSINISKPIENNKKNIFESKRKEVKESLMKPSKKKIREIKEFLSNPVINRGKKIGEIKKSIQDSKNNIFK